MTDPPGDPDQASAAQLSRDQCLNCGKPIYLITLADGTKRWTHEATGRRITRCGDPGHASDTPHKPADEEGS